MYHYQFDGWSHCFRCLTPPPRVSLTGLFHTIAKIHVTMVMKPGVTSEQRICLMDSIITRMAWTSDRPQQSTPEFPKQCNYWFSERAPIPTLTLWHTSTTTFYQILTFSVAFSLLLWFTWRNVWHLFVINNPPRFRNSVEMGSYTWRECPLSASDKINNGP